MNKLWDRKPRNLLQVGNLNLGFAVPKESGKIQLDPLDLWVRATPASVSSYITTVSIQGDDNLFEIVKCMYLEEVVWRSINTEACLTKPEYYDSDSYLFPKSVFVVLCKVLRWYSVELPYIIRLVCCSYFHRVDPPTLCDTIFSNQSRSTR